MINIANELKAKLLKARSAEETAALLEKSGVDAPMAGQIWDELSARRGDKELSLDELETISGGADRDWLIDGCAATVEPGSWCGSNDACCIWDVTYDHQPREFCSCGGIMYYTFGTTKFKCISCGKEKDISNESSRPIGQGRNNPSKQGRGGKRP